MSTPVAHRHQQASDSDTDENESTTSSKHASVSKKSSRPWGCLLGVLLANVLVLIIIQAPSSRNSRSTNFAATTTCKSLLQRQEANLTNSTALQPPLSICQGLWHGSMTASALWKAHLNDILEASIHPFDADRQVHRPWQADLLNILAPTLLERGLINMAGSAQVQTVMTIIERRRRTLHMASINSNFSIFDDESPPLRVAVMGGSVPEGRECNVFPHELQEWLANIPGGLSPRELEIRGKWCSWPFRLQLLADAFLGKDVVRIYNLAVGGTASISAIPTIEYRLYPEQDLIANGGPDVVINGFAVNDNLPKWGTEPNTTSSNEHWDDRFSQAQDFVYEVINKAKQCHGDKPIMIFLDDYFGNQNAEIILAEDIRSDAIRMLCDYYGLLYVSASRVAWHFVMANEPEAVFSPKWTRGDSDIRNAEGHYNMPGHQHVAYSLAYAFLKSAVQFCANDHFRKQHLGKSHLMTEASASLVRDYPYPPIISNTTTLSNMSLAWRDNADLLARVEHEYCHSADAQADPCPFRFVATPAGTAPTQYALEQYIRPFVTENTGWRAVNDLRFGWQSKIGLVASEVGASITFTIPRLRNPIRVITIHYIKSYGEKWAGSAAQFDLQVYRPAVSGDISSQYPAHNTSFTLSGEWETEASLTHPERIDLDPNATHIGDTVSVRVTLQGGQEFKIVALLLCSR